ncbi:hypothetical protein EJ08DRAFT_150173 [Tothia fuscella]|uniref:UBC core domain-containing protein n=1 Tax=Tothia fuscella TaxID=1048955 RepID=A0A9P4P3A0_9PEZI|nr:hypothetical protein EJ08DRAFT_150173 [Tothia fuscella]
MICLGFQTGCAEPATHPPISTDSMPLSSFSKQNLLLEFSSLKYACPDGVYVTITPGEASLWSGILSVRKGPYAPAVLRFQISFPSQFPAAAPLITFSTDIFHPLLTPLTTLTYTTNASTADTVSATDDERLPPGGFSLRHGFPQWFRKSSIRGVGSRVPSASSASPSMSDANSGYSSPHVTVFQLLEYIRCAFSDADLLDSIPVEAAANPGAYQAWQSYRGRFLDNSSETLRSSSPATRGSSGTASLLFPAPDEVKIAANRSRQPGAWNWDGVWEERVKKGVQNSLSEAVLFGSAVSGDDIIRFSDMEPNALQRVTENIARCY